ncbi:MAG: dTDP-4-dehydrorhamnose reductase [Ilumatobacteraceae bacterium]
MKIFITGAGGQLGHELVRVAEEDGHSVMASTHDDLDITKPADIRDAFVATRPDVVIHAAAWTAVDACEGDADRAFAVNGTATDAIARAAHEVGARVVYISTDYVFDGRKPTAYVETDEPNPQSVYGESKLAGERAMSDHDAIVRISWVCGFHGPNMVKTILRLAESQPELRFVNDQIGCPTFADDAATMILRLAEEQRRGVWHVTNQGVVSWFDFAQEVLRAAGMDPQRVSPVSTDELIPPRPARRPANSVLDNSALRLAGLPLLDDFQKPLQRLVTRLRL